MEDPVSLLDGQTYEREAIERWLAQHDTSPLTRQVLPRNARGEHTLVPNRALRDAIEDWASKNQTFQNAININDLRLNTSELPLSSMTDADIQACPLFSRLATLNIQQTRRASIGVGQEKSVYRGFLKGKAVAILHMRRGTCETEARIFTLLGRHPHLIRFHGVAVGNDGSQNLVTDLAPLGNMETVLENNHNTLRNMVVEKIHNVLLEVIQQVFVMRSSICSRLYHALKQNRVIAQIIVVHYCTWLLNHALIFMISYMYKRELRVLR
jgi:hypothetical protein